MIITNKSILATSIITISLNLAGCNTQESSDQLTKLDVQEIKPTTPSPESTDPEPTDPEPTDPEPTNPEPTNPEPTNPEPTNPEPTNPEPTNPEPTDPEPTDPEPTDPEPTDPEPTDPEPTDPEPTDPEPTDPEPTEPEPTEPEPTEPEPINPDLNGDGTLNILVIGSNHSISSNTEAFSPDQISTELQSILNSDTSLSIDINVVVEDIYRTKNITTGLGGSGTRYDYDYYSHSLAQYYYWPEGRDQRMNNLSGNGDTQWDYVVIGADPHIVATVPGYYSLGVNKIAAKVAEGEAQPLLLMMWQNTESSTDHFEEFTYRTADGAKVQLPVVPAGLAWEALPMGKKDVASVHPTPNGAYLAAASIYSQISGKSAASSDYLYDDELANIALSTLNNEENTSHYLSHRAFMSPFKSCDITDDTLNYNHTGSSSENGILNGLNWVFSKVPETLKKNGTSPINFNYGRANTNFEAHKRYKIDPEKFDFSLGFPMQDHKNSGNVSMLYGLDKRSSEWNNGTDLGTALFMERNSELPHARAIPIRTLFAQMREAMPTQSAYRDNWHMHRNLEKAIAAYTYTLLTGNCSLDAEPAEQDSDGWKTWMSHKIGYETAWNLMYLEGSAPACDN